MRRIILAAGIAAVCAIAARAQTLIFADSRAGVSFRYPATWKSATRQPFLYPLLVSDPAVMPHAVVYTQAIPGIAHWPETEFSGAALAYDARPADSAEACRGLSLGGDKHATAKGDLVLHGVEFWHSTAEDGGMSKVLAEDIYATYLGRPRNLCLLFDFGVYSVLAPADVPLRALHAREKDRLHQTELNLLSSIRVPGSSR